MDRRELDHLSAQIEQGIERQRLPTDAVSKRHAFQILHRYKRLTILLPDFVDSADVRMVQRRRSTSFAPEAFQRLWVIALFSVLSADDQAQLQTLLKKLGRHAESVPCSLKP